MFRTLQSCARNIQASYKVVVRIRFRTKDNEMTTATETLTKVASANARHAADAAEEVAENVSDLANDVTRKAGKQFNRAANMATDAFEEAHEEQGISACDARARSRSWLLARRNRNS